jgi:hypothetical protein
MHTKEGILYGLLISGDAGVRSYIDDEIIITRTFVFQIPIWDEELFTFLGADRARETLKGS